MKRAFSVGAAARELVTLGSLEQRITYTLAGAIEHLALDPDRVESIFRGLADHEMGHTMGLRHNFAGSTDSQLEATYWRSRERRRPAMGGELGLGRHEYSTVMDYGSRFNTDVQGLGRYDYAAIRFGYGQLIDTMPNAQESANQLSYDIFFGDYSTIPKMVGGVDTIRRRPRS